MSWSKAWVQSENRVELLKQVLGLMRRFFRQKVVAWGFPATGLGKCQEGVGRKNSGDKTLQEIQELARFLMAR